MNRSTARLTTLAGALLAGGIALTGCSGDSTPAASDTSSSSTSASTGAPSDADVTFAAGMLPHHQQAVQMARLAPDRAADPRVRDLATRIEAAQGPEIETLSGWLESWGAAGHSGTDDGGMDHGGMGGSMSDEDMASLAAASGSDFDRMFLDMMVQHHRGATAMAEDELAAGRDPGALAMAEDIRDTQTAEIAEMEQLLAELGG